jgi:hypothetical protein
VSFIGNGNAALVHINVLLDHLLTTNGGSARDYILAVPYWNEKQAARFYGPWPVGLEIVEDPLCPPERFYLMRREDWDFNMAQMRDAD